MFRFLSIVLLIIGMAAPALAEPPTNLKKCSGCHGKSLEGKKKAPAIAGADEAAILKSLGPDGPKPMNSLAKKLTDEEKTELAKFISALPKVEPKADPKAVPAPEKKPEPAPAPEKEAEPAPATEPKP